MCIMMSKNSEPKAVINGQPLFSLRNNGPENTGHLWNLPNGVITSRLWSLITPSLDGYHSKNWSNSNKRIFCSIVISTLSSGFVLESCLRCCCKNFQPIILLLDLVEWQKRLSVFLRTNHNLFKSYTMGYISGRILFKDNDLDCCVFQPAFGCHVHSKAGQTTFFSRFQPFLLISNLFQWFHVWNQEKTSFCSNIG